MVWIEKYFPYAGLIRIPIGEIYHYAVYISDDEIIQFGEPPALDKKIPDSAVKVCVTTLNRLLTEHKYIEGARLDEDEFKNRLDINDTISRARASIGSGGYSFLFNNCEHFANYCVFGKHFSSQAEELRKRFLDIPICDIYIAEIPENQEYSPIYPTERYNEISAVSNMQVKAEKYYAWRLLEIAIERSLGYDFSSLKFEKLPSGKWVSDRCQFSISHSNGLVAVAVSKKPVGIDIEKIEKINNEALPKRILSEYEYNHFSALMDTEKIEYLIKMWTIKEANFKYSPDAPFSPKNTIVNDEILYCERLTFKASHYYLSVVSEDIKNIKIFKGIKL